MERPQGLVPLRGGTRPDESRRNLGSRVAAVAAMLGTPLLPWQRYVVDVATEIDETTGSFHYDHVVLSAPRQCGKSALVDVNGTCNASLGPGRRIVYAAQTGKDAEDHFKAYTDMLGKSRLRQKVSRCRFSNGNMSATFANGSTIAPMAMTKVAGHGKQMDLITIDEAFSLTKEAGDTINDAILPTMNTRLKRTGITAQRWTTSTEGDSTSTYFNDLLDGLRAGDVPERTCWFDFGIPADADPEDLDEIMRWHPAAGYLWYRPQLADFRASFEDNVRGFARAFGNRRDMGVSERIISEDLWETTWCEPSAPTHDVPLAFGVAVDVDATGTAIAVALDVGDAIRVQLVATLDGTGSAVDEVIRLAETYKAPVCMDAKGPAADLHDRLDSRLEWCDLSSSDYLAVGQAFVSGLETGRIRHAADPDLDASCANSARTWTGDAWRITRRGSAGHTAPLEAAMLAAWGVTHIPKRAVPFVL